MSIPYEERERERREEEKKTNTVCEEIEKNFGNAWNSRRVNMSLDVGVCGSFGRCPDRDTDEKVIKNCLLLLLFISCLPFPPFFLGLIVIFLFFFLTQRFYTDQRNQNSVIWKDKEEKTRSFAKEI